MSAQTGHASARVCLEVQKDYCVRGNNMRMSEIPDPDFIGKDRAEKKFRKVQGGGKKVREQSTKDWQAEKLIQGRAWRAGDDFF